MPATRRHHHSSRNRPSLFRPNNGDFLAYALLEHVLHGNREHAKELYTLRPDLLFTTATAIDCAFSLDENFEPVHRVITSTPYRAIIASGNVWMLNDLQNNDIIRNYVDPTSNKSSFQLMYDELQAQFPHGFHYPPATLDYYDLSRAISSDEQLIAHNIPSAHTKKILAQFRKICLPNLQAMNEITGYFFNLLECANAFLYLDTLSERWHQNQVNFFFVQVTGNLFNMLSFIDAVLFLRITQPNISTPNDEANGSIDHHAIQFLNLKNHRHIESFFTSNASCKLGRDFSLNVHTPVMGYPPNKVVGTDHYKRNFNFLNAIENIQAMKVVCIQNHFETLVAALRNVNRPAMI